MPKFVKIILVVILFAALAGVSAYVTIHLIVKGEDSVIVPDLGGKEIVYALQMLTDLGLNTKVMGAEYSDELSANHIIYQRPSAGSEIKAGRDVHVIISKGSMTRVVPRLIGSDLERARLVLTENGLCMANVVRVHHGFSRAGQILAHQPGPGATIHRNTCVDLLVSLGASPVAYAMPDLGGLPVEDAVLAVENLGFRLSGLESDFRPGQSPDIVIGQLPPEGHRVGAGDAVSLVINRSPGSHGRGTPSIRLPRSGLLRYRLGNGFLKEHVRLSIRSASGAMDLFDDFVAPAQELWFIVPLTGNTSAMLFVDDELVKTELFDR